jgi:hypothetical protein
MSNNLASQTRDATRRQLVTATTAKLALELQFDTTVTGESVRELTLPVKRLLRPDEADTATTLAVVPPLTQFEWGSFLFSGIVESYRETLDFWSAEGVPLRALVSISLSQHTEPPRRPANPPRRPIPPAATTCVCTPTGVGGALGAALSSSSSSEGGGFTSAARSIASANGEESLRSSSSSSLVVPSTSSSTRPGVAGADSANVGRGTRLSDRLRSSP